MPPLDPRELSSDTKTKNLGPMPKSNEIVKNSTSMLFLFFFEITISSNEKCLF